MRSCETGDRLMDSVRDKIIEMDRDIRSGNIDISPLEQKSGNTSICSYCDFSAVCKFDENCKTTRYISRKDNEVWDILDEKKDGEN